MTCSDVMTSSLRCCYPSDTVVRAAEIMRDEDVGPVPVVDPNSGKLVGLITDRDITINVVARGGDCTAMQVQEIMSSDLVTCSIDDDYSCALDAMSRHQVRRIPVVHSDGTLAGIISQADVARFSSEAETGQVVEDISDASYGFGTMTHTVSSSAPSLLMGAACFTIGAACMYMMDPERGRSRRARTRDKAVRLYHDSTWVAGKVQRDLMNRTSGTMAELKHRFSQGEDDLSEDKLVARIRSKMGHYCSHPHAIHVSCSADGHCQLTGDILAEELPALLSGIRSVPGVHSIDDRLDVHQTSSGISSLQGTSERGRTGDLSPAMRFLVGLLGSGLAIYGLKANGAMAKTAGGIGLGLVASGVTNTPVSNIATSISNWSGMQHGREIH